jgi:2-iminobutanoate/2-iminopropanoate deaminase
MRTLSSLLLGALSLISGTVAAQSTAQTQVEFLNSGKVVPATLPFSEAVRVNDTLYLSGTLGNVPGTMKLAPGGIRGEAKQTMDNVRTMLQAHGYAMKDLVKCTVMLADINEWQAFNEVYQTYFEAPYPARSAFAAAGLALNARVEVDCIAVKR